MAKRKSTDSDGRPLNPTSAMARIRDLWASGRFLPLPHAQRRMRERGITTDHIGQVIRAGRAVVSGRAGGNWRYEVRGHTIDGVKVTCIVEIGNRLMLITVIDK